MSDLGKKIWKEFTKPLSWQATIVTCVFIIALVVLMLAFLLPPVEFKGNCEVDNIAYVNICPEACWNNEISCRFCPLPRDFNCGINMKAPILKIMAMLS